MEGRSSASGSFDRTIETNTMMDTTNASALMDSHPTDSVGVSMPNEEEGKEAVSFAERSAAGKRMRLTPSVDEIIFSVTTSRVMR